MSGVAYRTQQDMTKYRKAYMDTLGLQIKNDDINDQANKVYQRTGAPSQLVDTRDATEKLRDLTNLRMQLRGRLTEIMSGADANAVSSGLNDDEARFVAQQINTIIKDLKPKFALGVPATAFNQYLARLMQKFNETQGVDYPLQNIPELRDLQEILRNVRELGLDNTEIGRDITQNIADLRQAINELPLAVEAIQENQNAILTDEILREVDGLLREMPTSAQLAKSLQLLNTAMTRRDMVLAETVMREIASITSYSGDLQAELAALRETISQTEPLQMATAEEIPEATVLSVGLEPKVIVKEIEYGYIPLIELRKSSFPNTSRVIGKPSMKDYLEAIRKIDPEAAKKIGLTKNLDKTTAIIRLEREDETIKQLWARAQPEALLSGKSPPQVVEFTEDEIQGSGFSTGLNPHKKLFTMPKMPRMKGKGLMVDETAGLPQEADYVPFGKHLINRRKLKDGVIMVKRRNGAFIPELKTKRISPNLQVVFNKMAGGAIPSFSELERLDDEEREYLKFVSNRTSLSSKLDVPSPKKDKNEELINQFSIIRGQLIAGNDSQEMIKKFKKIIVDMIDRELLPKGQARDILVELAKIE